MRGVRVASKIGIDTTTQSQKLCEPVDIGFKFMLKIDVVKLSGIYMNASLVSFVTTRAWSIAFFDSVSTDLFIITSMPR